MRRRFSRRGKRGGNGDGRAPIDAARTMERILEAGVSGAAELEPLQRDDIPDTFAAVGRGKREDGGELVVAFAPAAGGDALLAALAAARGLGATNAEGVVEPFGGEVIAVSPLWTGAGLQRLAHVGSLPFPVRALAAPQLAEGGADLDPEPALPAAPIPLEQVSAQLTGSQDRDLFERAARALEGLASKHAGALRGTPTSVELVVLARRVAALRAEQGVVLETLSPQRSTQRLSNDELAGALDRLEGQLRKRINDRRVRDGEEGKRSQVTPLLAVARELRAVTFWPLGGSDREVLDLVGVDAEGRPVAGFVREEFGLPELAEVLDAVVAVQPVLPVLLARAEAPLRIAMPRVAIAAEGFTEAATQALESLSFGHDLFQVRSGARGFELVVIESAAAAPRSRRRPPRRGRGPAPATAEREEPEAVEASDAGSEASEQEESTESDGDSRRRPRRRGRRRRGGRGEEREGRSDEEGRPQPPAGPAVMEDDASAEAEVSEAPLEISLFDLDDESFDESDEDSGRRRRRGRRRRGRRPSSGNGDDSAGDGDSARASEDGDSSDSEPPAEGDEDVVDIDDSLSLLSDDAPDFEETVPEPSYDDDDEEDGDKDADRRRIEREKRRRVRQQAKVAEEPPPKPPRRRAAIVAHADRDSLLAAILLARDLRLIEGVWVYPQNDLMTFFRSVTTDLRDDTPICIVGFTPSPAGEVLQMVSLYADRLQWFDHHDWPPEDLDALKSALDDDALHVTPGAGSALPSVLSVSTRRSRFSDKLVDLSCGRFTQHDYERWGRVWWARLGEIASRPGDRRSDVDPLLVGRPSDLAKEAARVPAPPVPEEVAFVSQRDFRIVYFAGYSMVVIEAPEGLDLHLTARIARERYCAPFALSRTSDSDLVVLSADDSVGKGSFDLGAVVEHLGNKLEYVEPLADEDHVARFRVKNLSTRPERLDEVIAEIAMGRSLIEG